MPTIANSTFLDLTSYGTTTATTVEAAYSVSGRPAFQDINVAFILPRANDPSALLSSNWATRQTTLQELRDNGTLWSTYGATASDYSNARSILSGHGTIIGSPTGATDGYVTSQDSRTIWVTLTPNGFESLFGTKAYQAGDLYYWNGNLSVPNGLNVAGLWFDTAPWFGTPPAASDLSGGARAVVHEGPQSIGNYLSTTFQMSNYFPGAIARDFYNFPLAGKDVPTTTVGLIEPGIGDAMPSASPTFLQGLNAYRQAAGVATPGEYYVVGNVAGQSYANGNNGERSLDVGVIASAAPGSKIGLYAGSGFNAPSHANVFTSYQTAFWDTVNNPTVLSSSFSIFPQTNPSSVFHNAIKELFIDGALRGVTMVQANNDFGSSWDVATGLANQLINSSSPFMLLVGGTSLTTIAAAPFDPTIASDPSGAASLYGLAMSGDVAALWRLVEGGLTKLPNAASGTEAASHNTFLEAVWNSWVISNGQRTPKLGASDGGVDTTQPTPWYQTAFGLAPTSVNPGHATGRGAPDVSADSGGNMFYAAPNGDFSKIGAGRGDQRRHAAVGIADGPGRHDLRRPGPAASGLRQRSPLHRGRHRARFVQRHHLRQQRHVLHRRRVPRRSDRHRCRRQSHHAHRLRLFRGPRLRPDDGFGLAQRRAAVTRDDGDRPFADVVQLEPGHARCRWRRLGERRRPEPDVPDHVGLGDHGGRRHRHGGLRLLEPGVRYLRLDQPAGAAGAAVRLRSPPGAPVRQAGAGLGRAIRRRGG